MGKKLLFIDLVDNEHKVQVMVDIARLQRKGNFNVSDMDNLRRTMSVGDYYGTDAILGRFTIAANVSKHLRGIRM